MTTGGRVVLGLMVAAVLAGCGVLFGGPRGDLEQRIVQLERELALARTARATDAQRMTETYEALARELKDELARYQAHVEMTERGLVITFLSEILFDSGKADLRSDGVMILDRVGDVLETRLVDRPIAVEGHTDNVPITHSAWRSNWELSTARATSVIHHLVTHGIRPERLAAVGYGEYRPVTSNDTAVGRQQNRRVELVIPPEGTVRQRDAARAEGEAD